MHFCSFARYLHHHTVARGDLGTIGNRILWANGLTGGLFDLLVGAWMDGLLECWNGVCWCQMCGCHTKKSAENLDVPELTGGAADERR